MYKSESLIISTTKEFETVEPKERYEASIIIINGKVCKSRLDLDSSDILLYAETPEVLQGIIDVHIKKEKAKMDKVKEEFKYVSHDDKSELVDIQITGRAGSGKTNIALLIHDTLKEYGIRTNLIDEDLGYSDIEVMRENRVSSLKTIGERTGVDCTTSYKRKSQR